MIMIIPIIHAVMIQYASGCCIAWKSRDCRNDRRVFIPNKGMQNMPSRSHVMCQVIQTNICIPMYSLPRIHWCIDSGMQTKDHFQQRSDAGLLPGSVSKISEIPVWYMSTMHPKITESCKPRGGESFLKSLVMRSNLWPFSRKPWIAVWRNA